MNRRPVPVDEPIKTWCGTCGRKFYGSSTDCPECEERRRKALAAGTGACPAGGESKTGRTERR
jgi:hypothetical protein